MKDKEEVLGDMTALREKMRKAVEDSKPKFACITCGLEAEYNASGYLEPELTYSQNHDDYYCVKCREFIPEVEHLKIEFGDNDFGWPIEIAARQLWTYIDNNNNGPRKADKNFSGKSTADIFRELLRVGTLKSLLMRLYLLEDMKLEVEGLTRGLYWTGEDFTKCVIEEPDTIDRVNTYLDISISIESSERFTWTWQNGEVCALNLETGHAWGF